MEDIMESKLSPCSLTKESLSRRLKGFLEDGEYISDWKIGSDKQLHLTISIDNQKIQPMQKAARLNHHAL